MNKSNVKVKARSMGTGPLQFVIKGGGGRGLNAAGAVRVGSLGPNFGSFFRWASIEKVGRIDRISQRDRRGRDEVLKSPEIAKLVAGEMENAIIKGK